MSWQEKIKNHRHFSKVKYFLALPVFLLLLFLLMRWSPSSSLSTLNYLPSNTNFYWQWSSPEFLDNKILEELSIIQAQVLQEQQNSLQALLLDAWPQVKELTWFKVDGSEQDNYILRLPNAKLVAKNLANIEPKYNYQVLTQDVLLIYTGADSLVASDQNMAVPENLLKPGVNIYWQVDKAPEFLNNLSEWLRLAPDNPAVYANLRFLDNGKLSFSVWQNKLRRLINASSSYPWPNQALVPYDSSTVVGFTNAIDPKQQQLISQYFINNLFPELPYYNISQEELEGMIFRGSFILRNQDAWLMLALSDWQPVASKLLPDFKLKEVKKLLPDRTAYTAYELDEQSQLQKHSYRGQEYWQLGNLYGWNNNQAYYLSNQAGMIEKTIASQTQLVDLLLDCSLQNVQLDDLLILQTNTLPASSLQQVLQARGVDNLKIFSYQNEEVIGWQACF